MTPPNTISRRRFLQRSFAFSAAGVLAGCGSGINALSANNATDPVTGGTAQFLAIGDWGEVIQPNGQADVAFGMQKYVSKYGITTDALLMLGDNFYGNLHGGDQSTRFQTQFEDMYPTTFFDCPALAIPGNHDYQVEPIAKYPAELQYALNGNTRWTMPAQYYRAVFPAVNPLVTMLFVDTNMPNEPAQPIPPPGSNFYTMTDTNRQEQLEWLAGELAKPLTTPYLVVCGHHPVYSNGAHGDNQTLIRDFDPLFRQYGVHLYLAGHDHDLQHLEFAGHPTSFVCSGGGGSPLYALPKLAHPHTPYAVESFGFTHLQIRQDTMIVRHLDQNGGLLHKFTKSPSGDVVINK